MEWERVLHWVTLIPKYAAMVLFRAKNLLWDALFLRKRAPSGGFPSYSSIRSSYELLCGDMGNHCVAGPYGTLLLIRDNGSLSSDSSDHQGIRQGALAWAYPEPGVVSGLLNFMVEGEFKRGVESGPPWEWNGMTAPPAIGIALCQGIHAGLNAGVEISEGFRVQFRECVDRLIARDFTNADCSIRPRIASTAFDAIYALALLATAMRLSGKGSEPGIRYRALMEHVVSGLGYGLLLRAPVTYLSRDRRPYFLEHLAMVGLYGCWQGSRYDYALQALFEKGMRFVGSQSRALANPYFAALRQDCEAIDPDEVNEVLEAHKNASPSILAGYRRVERDGLYPVDWSTAFANEFAFDDIPKGNATSETLKIARIELDTPLSGVVLAASLMKLMGRPAASRR